MFIQRIRTNSPTRAGVIVRAKPPMKCRVTCNGDSAICSALEYRYQRVARNR